jgi:hypothetical protein
MRFLVIKTFLCLSYLWCVGSSIWGLIVIKQDDFNENTSHALNCNDVYVFLCTYLSCGIGMVLVGGVSFSFVRKRRDVSRNFQTCGFLREDNDHCLQCCLIHSHWYHGGGTEASGVIIVISNKKKYMCQTSLSYTHISKTWRFPIC